MKQLFEVDSHASSLAEGEEFSRVNILIFNRVMVWGKKY